MMILTGAPSLSAFRRKKLLSTLQQTVPSTVSVYAEYVHFAELTQPLSESAVETLQALLTYGPREEKTSTKGQLILVGAKTRNYFTLVEQGHGYSPQLRSGSGCQGRARHGLLCAGRRAFH